MKTLHSRAKITKIEGNRIYYGMPQAIYGMNVTGLNEPRIFDPANLKRDFLLISKAAYIGSKRRLRSQIVKMVPDEARTCFDPMCGVSWVLWELALQGKEVWGNELNPIAYHFSKALFLTKKPSEEECKDFIVSIEQLDGYFVEHDFWPTTHTPKNYRGFLDGFISKAQESDHSSFYIGVMAGHLSRIVGSFGGPYDMDTTSGFNMKVLKIDLLSRAKEILKCEVTGKITNLNAFTMNIPDVDLIYFDPPYSEDNPSYFKRYSKIISILLQKDWDVPPEPKQTQIAEFGQRLANHADLLLISSTSGCPVSWKKELQNPRREISLKRFKLTGASIDNAARNRNQKTTSEHLWISAKKSLVDITKAQDPFMIYPPEDRTHNYSLRIHFGGKSVHGDLLMENLQKSFLLGWILTIEQVGKITEPVLTMQDARKIVSNSQQVFNINLQTGDWAKRQRQGVMTNVSLMAKKKVSVKQTAWLNFEGITKASDEEHYVYLIADKGKIEYLAQRTDFHEYFMDGKVFRRGRYVFRQLKAWSKKMMGGKIAPEDFLDEDILRGSISSFDTSTIDFYQAEKFSEKEIIEQIQYLAYHVIYEEESLSEGFQEKSFEGGMGPDLGWLCIKPIDQIPYVLSSRAISKKWLPPKDFSSLPEHWRKHIQDEEKYWEMDGAKALDARKALKDRFRKEGILGKAAKGEVDPFGTGSGKKEEEIEDALTPSDVDSLIPQQKPTKKKRKKKKRKDIQKSSSIITDFRLTYQWWNGSEQPSKYRYHIWLRTEGKKVLDFFVNDNILGTDSIDGILYKDRSEQDFEIDGYIKPGTKLNPTKSTPSFMKILDKGNATILIDNEDTKKVQFRGAKLKGTFLFTNVNDSWEIKRVKEESHGR